MFGKGLQMVSKVKDQVNSSFFNKGSNLTIKLSLEQCPPLVIDDVVFKLNSLSTAKESKKKGEKIIKHYDKNYLKDFESKSLTVQIVGEKYFFFVVESTQTFYNHTHSTRNPRNQKNYQKSVRKIYESEKMMEQFWSIDFCNLKVLNISRHKLTSIQGITFTNLPHLQCLELHSNNLQSIDCLTKITTPNLRILTVYNNRVQTANKLTRLNSNRLKVYEFDREDTDQEQKIENLDFMFKMKSLILLEKIYIQDENRICESKKLYFLTSLTHRSKLPYSHTRNRLQRVQDNIMNELAQARRQINYEQRRNK